jgi:enamine deaminase RidA (YjgF/YER057c/UK114 family)
MKRQTVYTGKPVEKKYQYAPGVVARKAGLLFVAGQAGWDEHGNIVGLDDPATQARQAFENLKAVLEQAGASLADVVKETEYVTDLALYRDIARVRKDYFPDNFPAATLVEVKGLFKKGQVFEIEAIAVVE